MSLIATLQAGIETAFSAASELVVVGTYVVKGGDPVYDPVTDTQSGGEVQVPNVRMLASTVSVEEREASSIAVSDVAILIPYVDLPGVTPAEADHFVMAGVTYNVVAAKKIPGQAIHKVFGREK